MRLQPVFRTAPAVRRVPVCAEPLAVYECLYCSAPYAFLYESLEGNQRRGRYSFIGGSPRLVFESRGGTVRLHRQNQRHTLTANPLEVLRQLVGRTLDVPGVAPFVGGAVGYLGYDMVRFYESIPNENPDDLQFPESLFIFPEEVIVFDHVAGETHLIVYADTHENGRLDYMEQYVLASNRTASQTARNLVFSSPSRDTAPMSSRTSEPQFTEAVRRAKE
ncbi:MAG: hypothetical protein PVI86_19540, partial [Phycisphaerae bacterium]